MKRIGIILLQLLVTAAGLCYVFHNPQRRAQIAEALRHASLSWVLLGWICYSVVEMLATVRWQILLRIQGIRISWLRAGAIVIIGLFPSSYRPGKLRRAYQLHRTKVGPSRARNALLYPET
jgi:uncharacterized protein (TIRG00374 family)